MILGQLSQTAYPIQVYLSIELINPNVTRHTPTTIDTGPHRYKPMTTQE